MSDDELPPSGDGGGLVLTDLQTAAGWPADRNPVKVYLFSRLGPGSRDTMARALSVVAGLLQGADRADPERVLWPAVRYQHVARVKQLLDERFSPGTTNRILCAVRGVLKECWRLEFMGAEDYHRAADVEGIEYELLPPGRSLSAGEFRTLFKACAQDPRAGAGARDAALLALQYGVLLRRAEVCALTMEDANADTGEVTVRQGKGRKDRLGHLPPGGRLALEAWLGHRGDAPGPLLGAVLKSGRVVLRRHLSPPAILKIYERRAEATKISPFTSHDLRRSGISDLLDAGADLVTVKKMAGHSSEVTTGRYDRRGEDAKRRAAALLRIPFAP